MSLRKKALPILLAAALGWLPAGQSIASSTTGSSIIVHSNEEKLDAFLTAYRQNKYSFKEAEEIAEALIKEFRTDEVQLRARANSLLMQIYSARGKLTKTKSIYEQYTTVGIGVVPPSARIRMFSTMLQVYWRMSENDNFMATQEAMLDTLELDITSGENQIPAVMRASAMITLSQGYLSFNNYARGLELLYRGRHLLISSEEIDRSLKERMLLIVQRDLVALLQDLGTFDIAEEFAQEGMENVDNLPHAEQETVHYFWAYQLMKSGRYEEANTHFRSAVELAMEDGDLARAADNMNLMSTSLFLAGEYEESLDVLMKFVGHYSGSDEQVIYSLHKKVFDSLNEVMDIPDETKARFPEVIMDDGYQDVWWALERDDLFMLQMSAEHSEKLGTPFEYVESLSALYQYYTTDYQSKVSGTSYKKLISDEAKINGLVSEQLQKRVDLQNKLLTEKKKQTDYTIGLSVAGLIVVLLVGFLFRREVKVKRNYSDMAMKDPLTNSPNRRAIKAYAEEAMLHARSDSPSSVGIALIDLDHFKQVNDTYGHDVGDKVLKAFYDICHPLLREGDRLGRYGGEEFLMVLPDASESDVEQIFSRLQMALKETEIVVDDEVLPITITMSMGATIHKPTGPKATNPFEKLMKLADDHVYEAKSAGRDCLVLA